VNGAVLALLDAAAGVSLLLIGILGWRRFRGSAAFALAAAGAWFCAAAVPELVLLHRPLLVHSVLALPRRRIAGIAPGALLAVVWVGVVLPPAAQPWASLAISALCGAAAWRLRQDARPSADPAAVPAARSLLVLAAGVGLPVIERAMWPQYDDVGLPLATYLLAVVVCSAVMVRWVLDGGLQETDAVIELADRTPAEALDELRRLAAGEADPRRGRALVAAAGLLEDNARLHSELAERIEQVRRSRARLLETAVDERQRLEGLLEQGALTYLRELEVCLRSTGRYARAEPRATACLDEIVRTREDLEQLARGLHPRILVEQGLARALRELCVRSPIPVALHAPANRLPEVVETTLWYACAECLANMWKYAHATSAVVRVEEAVGGVTVTVSDDGVGGAALTPGGGLMGLSDRLAAVGGRLRITSSTMGTDITIWVPLP
jgi:signal transduction histidine kinase